jgi:hypothetical protein
MAVQPKVTRAQLAKRVTEKDALISALVGALLEVEHGSRLRFPAAYDSAVNAALTLAGLDTQAKRDAERERRKA